MTTAENQEDKNLRASELFRRREAERRERARLPVEQKLEIAARLRDAEAALAGARAANKARREAARDERPARD